MDIVMNENMFLELSRDDLLDIEAGKKVTYYIGYVLGAAATLVYDVWSIYSLL